MEHSQLWYKHPKGDHHIWKKRFVMISDSTIHIYETKNDCHLHHIPLISIELCSTTSLTNGIDDTVYQDYLIKQNKAGDWTNKAWYTLVKCGYLKYSDPKKNTTRITSINIRNAEIILQKYQHLITIKNDREKSVHQFQCVSSFSQNEWYKYMLSVQSKCIQIDISEPTLFAFNIGNPVYLGHYIQRYDQHLFCADNKTSYTWWIIYLKKQIENIDNSNDEDHSAHLKLLRSTLSTNNISMHIDNRPKETIRFLGPFFSNESGKMWSDKFSALHSTNVSHLLEFNSVLSSCVDPEELVKNFISNLGLNHLCRLAAKHSNSLDAFDLELLRMFESFIHVNECCSYIKPIVEHNFCMKIVVDRIYSENKAVVKLTLSLLVNMVAAKDDQISILASNKILSILSELALCKGRVNKYTVLIKHCGSKVLCGDIIFLINYLIMCLPDLNKRMTERVLLNTLEFDYILHTIESIVQKSTPLYNDPLITHIQAYRKFRDADYLIANQYKSDFADNESIVCKFKTVSEHSFQDFMSEIKVLNNEFRISKSRSINMSIQNLIIARFANTHRKITCDIVCQQKIDLFLGLRYYQLLQNEHFNNKYIQYKLIKFYRETYPDILNHFIHTVTEHHEELDKMYDFAVSDPFIGLQECNVVSCKYADRHNRDRTKDKASSIWINDDSEFLFLRNLFDAIHCYLLHQYDFGLRIHKNDMNVNCQPENEYIGVSFKDTAFAFISKVIQSKKESYDTIARFNKRKYSLQTAETQTLMDALKSILSTQMENADCLISYLEEQEYDSDAMEEDIRIPSSSNILSHLNIHETQMLQNYLKETKLHDRLFSTGFIFYYWICYKFQEEKRGDEWNVIAHPTKKIYELYIEPKYDNLKQEITHNILFTLSNLQYKLTLTKATHFIKTHKCKKMEPTPNNKYGIHKCSKFKIENVLSIIFYTDWSELCSAFSATFRKNKLYDSLSSVKQRNREFAIWSRILRETVECYGNDGQEKFSMLENEKQSIKLKGPFFCGMSFLMTMPEFNIRLCGPTSTSKRVEVATRFGGDDGIIIELNNTGDIKSDLLHGFNCSWISNFNGEDEYLFFGGDYRIKIETIRQTKTSENFHPFFEALFLFDCMVTATAFGETTTIINDHNNIWKILNNLMAHQLKSVNFRNRYPQYVNNTFESYLNQKKKK
eukprot:198749_1